MWDILFHVNLTNGYRNGNYCYEKFQKQELKGICDECLLKTRQIKLSNPYFYNNDEASSYASRTSNCGVSSLPITTASPVIIGW